MLHAEGAVVERWGEAFGAPDALAVGLGDDDELARLEASEAGDGDLRGGRGGALEEEVGEAALALRRRAEGLHQAGLEECRAQDRGGDSVRR